MSTPERSVIVESENSPEQNLSVSPQAAAKEVLRLKDCANSLQKFTEETTPGWVAGKIHKAICEQFDRVERGEVDRLMLLCPPQHGKSQIASKRYPAYALGKNPRHDVISASAVHMLAEEFGRATRDTIASAEYQRIFPFTTLAEDSRAKGRWRTKQEGSYYAVGIGGAVMGRGADRFIVDDPFASMMDAWSETTRDKVWNWYTGTAYNRVRPGGAIIIINHRMHEEDLTGRLLAQQAAGGDTWTVVELPADVNDPPWPERYDRGALERIKANTDPLSWSALYMQDPVPAEGTFFKREWFGFYKAAQGNPYISSDFAVTEGGGDYTEIGTHRWDGETLYLCADYWRGQTAADEWIDRACDQILKHKPLCFFGETGPIRRSVEPFLVRRMRERRAWCRTEWINRPRDKATMARPLQAMAAMGKVKLPDTDDGHRLLKQLLAFPAGMTDDAVDMAGLMALAIDQAHPGVMAIPEPKPQRRDRYQFDDEDETESWRTA